MFIGELVIVSFVVLVFCLLVGRFVGIVLRVGVGGLEEGEALL